MNWLKVRNFSLLLILVLTSSTSQAYVVDPRKVGVGDVYLSPELEADFVLAYDSHDKGIVYYAPRNGRVAIINGMPMLGFARLPNGNALLNVQFEFGVFGEQRQLLLKSIQAAGYTPRAWPFKSTKIKPLTPEINLETGRPICTTSIDESTGQRTEDCLPSLSEEIRYSKTGPSLGEAFAITMLLNPVGASVYNTFLRSGNALQVYLGAEYYTLGTAFFAEVRVDFERLFQSFRAKAGFKYGLMTAAEIDGLWEQEGLCLNRKPEDCAIRVTYYDADDLRRERPLKNALIDPDDKEAQEKILQTIERLKQKLQDEMLVGISGSPPSTSANVPSLGFTVNTQYEKKMRGTKAVFEFSSPRGVNLATTSFPANIACIQISKDGDVSKLMEGDCAKYWGYIDR